MCVADVAVPGSETTGVPSPQFTVTPVGEFVAEKVTVTTWLITAGLGVSEAIVTTGGLTPPPTTTL